jgi:hypothetical protein
MRFSKPRGTLRTGLSRPSNRFGVLTVAAAARTWERLSAPVRVSWFPEGDRLEALVKPTPGTTIEPTTPIELTFSQPVKAVLGVTRPKLDPPTPGIWSQTSANQLTFRPTGSGFALGRQVVAPACPHRHPLSPGRPRPRDSHVGVPVGSTVGFYQLLAELGYLRSRGSPKGAAVLTTRWPRRRLPFTHRPEVSRGALEIRSELQALWKPTA